MLFMVLVVIIVIIFSLNLEKKRKNEPPVLPGALPFIGHAHNMLGSTKKFWKNLELLAEKGIELGHPFFIKVGNIKVYIITDPDDCNTVAQNCMEKPSLMYEFTKDLLGEGLLCCSSQLTWSAHRRVISPIFNQRILDGFIGIFNTNAKSLVADLSTVEGKGFFNTLEFTQKSAVKNTCSTLTGKVQCDDQHLEKIANTLNIVKEVIMERVKKIWFFYDPIYNLTKLKRIQDDKRKILKDEAITLFNQKKRFLTEQSPSETYDGDNVNSYVDLYMRLENKGLTEKEIIDEINTIMLASYDTSALLLMYALVSIGSYPHIQERLYEEIKENISYDEKNGYEIKKSNLSKLNYLDAVVKETLRTRTLVPIISRFLDKDINLKNYTLYKGNECILLINALHKHPMWGEDAHEFKPERWLNSERLLQRPYLFAGFGIGRRNCIGRVHAMMQSKITLAHVLMNYKVIGNQEKLVHKYEFLLEPDSGHHISLVRR